MREKESERNLMDILQNNLVKLIVETCNVTVPVPKPLPVETPLFGPESVFGLDSLDAVEVAVAIQQEYGLRITDRSVFQSLKSLAAYICDHLEAVPVHRCA
jgi:acyl carrier protein